MSRPWDEYYIIDSSVNYFVIIYPAVLLVISTIDSCLNFYDIFWITNYVYINGWAFFYCDDKWEIGNRHEMK